MASVVKQLNAVPSRRDVAALYTLVEEMRLDLESLRTQLNTHVHSGVTAGGANTAAPTTTAGALRTIP